jgi:non-heme chloroperoxidase
MKLAAWAVAVLLVLPGLPLGAQAAAGGSAALVTSFVKLDTGVTLQYVAQGEAQAPVIVLLHGAGDSWHSWELVLPQLPSRFRCYALTLRGHGLSDHPASGYSRADFAADVRAFLAKLDLRGVTLVGHSLGSFVAQEVAETDSAGRVKSLVLIGSGPGGPRDPGADSGIRSFFLAVHDPIDYVFARDFQAGTAYGALPPAFLETMIGEVQRVPARVFHELATNLTEPQAVERLSGIKARTLIFWGDKDTLFGRGDQDALLRAIPGSRLAVYPDTGHALHWEHPARFAKDLVAFASE